MGFAEQNIANSFEFAQKLVRAKDIQEVMALQQEYLQSQMKAMSAQAKDLGSAATRPRWTPQSQKSKTFMTLIALCSCAAIHMRFCAVQNFYCDAPLRLLYRGHRETLRQLVRAGRALTKREDPP